MQAFRISTITLLLLLYLVACEVGPESEMNLEEDGPSVADVAVADTASQTPRQSPTQTATTQPPASTPTITPTATTKPTFTPTPTWAAVGELTSCVLCHSDKDLLIETASPEEEKEPGESSGVG